MVVVNLNGFPYPVKLSNGNDFIIPCPQPPRPVQIPDECAGKFGGDGIRVLVPAKPVEDKKPEPVKETVKLETKKVKVKPLKGVKIKKKRREEILKEFKKKRENK